MSLLKSIRSVGNRLRFEAPRFGVLLASLIFAAATFLATPAPAAPLQTATADSMEPGSTAASNTAGVASSLAAPLSFKSSLAEGPNGPIPAIVVDQFGYPANARKVAVIRDPQIGYDKSARFTPGDRFALVDGKTGEVVKAAKPTPWNDGKTDPASGDRAWWFDFSDVTRPGTYVVVDIDNKARSPEFRIGDDVYRKALKSAVRMFFYQRAGYEKAAQYAGAAWADAASHLKRGQDPETKVWPGARSLFPPEDPGVRDLHGGWYDAGDYNKYATWAARNILVLLQAYEENSQAFGDDFGIPESNNGIPDLLDEVKWSLDWLIRMQEQDGSVLCIQSLSAGSPPSTARGPSYYGPPTTSATLMAAAAFASAAKIYRSQPGLEQYGADLTKRAKHAWTWAVAHPSVLYWNNDESRQKGSQGLGAGQQEMSDGERALAKFEAAVRLYELTQDPTLKDFAEAHYASLVPQYGPTLWEVDGQDAVLRFSRIEGLAPARTNSIQLSFLGHLAQQASEFDGALDRWDAYRAPLKDYTWGSNKAKAMQARLFQLVAATTQNAAVRSDAEAAALEYAHYIHGVNPLGLVYLSNMGAEGASHSVDTIFHAWFAKGTRWEKVSKSKPGPPPGFLVGGPNPSFSIDACCSAAASPGQFLCYSPAAESICKVGYRPPMGQPPAKSYRQFNDSWPANSWEVAEPSNSYQAYYIRLLASFVR